MRLHLVLTLAALGPAVGEAQDCSSATLIDATTTSDVASSSPVTGSAQFGTGLSPVRREFVELNGYRYFLAETMQTGQELFRTDGTAAGTSLVADVRPGIESSEILGLTVAHGKLWFEANDGVTGRELWTSDGTAAGTALVADIGLGGLGGLHGDGAMFVTLGSRIYFVADDGVHGDELWSSDGTSGGTSMVIDLAPGPDDGVSLGYLAAVPQSGRVVFTGTADASTHKLWSTDGTAGGTLQLPPQGAHQLVPRLGLVFFISENNLWRTDGTPAGTLKLSGYAPQPAGIYFTDLFDSAEVNGKLLYPGNWDKGWEVYVSDGTPAGTYEYLDLALWPTKNSNPAEFVHHAGHVYFTANDGTGRKLFRSTGHWNGTTQVFDPGTADPDLGPRALTTHQGRLWFLRDTAAGGTELWSTDGTPAGTVLEETEGGLTVARELTSLSATELLFVASEPATGSELYTLPDGGGGATLVIDLATESPTHSSQPSFLTTVANEHLLFLAAGKDADQGIHRYSPTSGHERLVSMSPTNWQHDPDFCTAFLGGALVTLFGIPEPDPNQGLWRTDGTAAGTQQLTPSWSATYWEDGTLFHAPSERAYFSGVTAGSGWELWRTDGTPGGTGLLVDLAPGGDSIPMNLTAFGPHFVFSADDGIHGREVWISDGTAAGTQLLADIHPTGDSDPVGFLEVGDLVYFTADDGNHGREPWVTDGTAAGTNPLGDLRPGTGGSMASSYGSSGTPFHAIGDRVVFSAGANLDGGWIHVSDGTPSGTIPLVTFESSWHSGNPSQFVQYGGQTYFVLKDTTGAWALYTSDLRPAGTVWVTDLPQESWSHYPPSAEPVVVDHGFFLALDMLVFSDGTQAGTVALPVTPLVGDDENPWNLERVGDRLFFTANVLGTYRLHVSDGTPGGTQVACATGPSTWGSDPGWVSLVDGQLAFTSTTFEHGTELAVMDVPGAHAADMGLGTSGSSLHATTPTLGQAVDLAVANTPAGSVGYLVLSAPADASASPLLALANVSWLHQPSAIPLAVIGATPWTTSYPIPALPALAGVTFHLQAWFLPGGAFPATSSNGVMLVLGS